MGSEAIFEKRHERMDRRNHDSWYMNDADRPFTVIQSIHSAGPPRVDPKETPVPYSMDFQKELNRAALSIVEYKEKGGRFKLGGNMSTVRRADDTVPYGPRNMTNDQRFDDALANMMEHFHQLDIDPANVRVLNPNRNYEHGLTIVNVDEDDSVYEGGTPIRLKEEGDFIYTYNPDVVLAVRPADCPIAVVSAETPKGTITMMIHFAWRGPATGEYEDMVREFDKLGVDFDTMKVYLTPGGHAESFHYRTGYYVPGKNNPAPNDDPIFQNVENHGTPEDPKYQFDIDTINSAYDAFKKLGLDDKQLFVDTTDTTAPESGTASNSRAVNFDDDNVRDIVTVQINKGA